MTLFASLALHIRKSVYEGTFKGNKVVVVVVVIIFSSKAAGLIVALSDS